MKILLIPGILLIATGLFFKNDIAAFVSGATKKTASKKAGRQKNIVPAEVTIKQKWDLPAVLIEVSGIAYIDAQRFACVQDEAGTIFIYNTATSTIEKTIAFTGPGDFEGIALNNNIAYIVRSDGVIFEVDMNNEKVQEHATFLTAGNNVESLFYDAPNSRLLLAGKEPDTDEPAVKNIYAFNVASKTLAREPVIKIDLAHEALARVGKSSNKKKYAMPSGIAIHPLNKDIYILDGPKQRLLVTQASGNVKDVYQLGKDFFKPEGISFSPAGNLFISNEGKKIPGNIMEVQIH